MTARVTIERLAIRLRGVSREAAEAALDGIGEELARRLARIPLSTLPTTNVFHIDLGRETITAETDVATLRATIAGRVVTGLTESRALPHTPHEDAP